MVYLALAGKRALIRGSEEAVTLLNAELSTVDDQTYTFDNELVEALDPTADITVYEAGTPTTEEFEVNRLTATITFEEVDANRGNITADIEYLPLSQIAQANEYDYSLSADNADISAFGDEYVEREQTLLDVTGSLSRWFELDDYFEDLLLDDEILLIEFYSFYDEQEENEPDLKAWVLLDTDDISAVVDGVVEQSVDFEGTHDIDNRTVSV